MWSATPSSNWAFLEGFLLSKEKKAYYDTYTCCRWEIPLRVWRGLKMFNPLMCVSVSIASCKTSVQQRRPPLVWFSRYVEHVQHSLNVKGIFQFQLQNPIKPAVRNIMHQHPAEERSKSSRILGKFSHPSWWIPDGHWDLNWYKPTIIQSAKIWEVLNSLYCPNWATSSYWDRHSLMHPVRWSLHVGHWAQAGFK